MAALRAALISRGCGAYRIFHSIRFDLHDVDDHLRELDEESVWEPIGQSLSGGEPLCTLAIGEDRAKIWEAGMLHLRKSEVFVARWLWCERTEVHSLILCAAPSAAHYQRLRKRVIELRHSDVPMWQIVGAGEGERHIPRTTPSPDDLILSDDLRKRIDDEITRFFSPQVAAMYASLRVPHRRGLLLYGPPGNGKTSLIRHIGAALPKAAAFLLRPGNAFNVDYLQHIIDRWVEAAPALLVIEDLDWLLQRINVSNFLNLIDGVEPKGGGLLLIATTNHPDKLDPAINNRPGRFDSVIEIPLPQEPQRLTFFRIHLAQSEDALVCELAEETEGFSFAHLQEILRLSGLLAIGAGRDQRDEGDLRSALATVRAASTQADRGFPFRADTAFGLGPLHAQRRVKRA